MAMIGNTPKQTTVLRLEVRKSFSLGLWFKDASGRALDISDTAIRLVAKKPPFGPDDSDNLFENGDAILAQPTVGYARIDLQATDLDYPPGEYPFSIVLVSEGYSVVVAKGVLDLQPNTEASSLTEDYTTANPPTSLQVKMRGHFALEVTTGPSLAPGTTSFTDADKARLDQIVPEAQVPPGGLPGEVLAKTGASDYALGWIARGSGGGGGLDATGVPSGYVPTANGANAWGWQENLSGVLSLNGQEGVLTLDMDWVPDSATRLALTPAERD